MDLVKIGKYIAGKRKDHGLTQRQLAEKLGMSDKSVSKWERGICLPDVSVYFELCQILDISIHEFLAGEDIVQEAMIQKSEENVLGLATESKRKQSHMKTIIYVLLAISLLALGGIAASVYRVSRPQNFLAPVDKDSVEMETANLLAGPDGAFLYTFTTTDAYTSLKVYCSAYRGGVLQNKECVGLGFADRTSPKSGEILLVPDFARFVVKLILVADGAKSTTEIPILEEVADRAYYGRSATELPGRTDIRYNEEQPLMALLYDDDEMRVLTLHDLMDGETDSLAANDFVYYFSFLFCKDNTS